MKKRLYLAGIAALVLVLSLMGCGAEMPGMDVSGMENSPAGIYEGDDGTLAPGGEESSWGEYDAEGPLSAGPEDPGTTAGEDPLYDSQPSLDEDGTYNSAEDVSLYLYTYGRLPENYITKSEARDLGWSGGPVEKYAPGCAIGGDRFGNREGVLPDGTYYECDIDTIGQDSRGAKRLVYTSGGQIYYTEDHYETFTLLYGEE